MVKLDIFVVNKAGARNVQVYMSTPNKVNDENSTLNIRLQEVGSELLQHTACGMNNNFLCSI